jgi:hypothetical protein
LSGTSQTIDLIWDHGNLTYFMINQLLNFYQSYKFELLSSFNFKIHYRPGMAYGKANALT